MRDGGSMLLSASVCFFHATPSAWEEEPGKSPTKKNRDYKQNSILLICRKVLLRIKSFFGYALRKLWNALQPHNHKNKVYRGQKIYKFHVKGLYTKSLEPRQKLYPSETVPNKTKTTGKNPVPDILCVLWGHWQSVAAFRSELSDLHTQDRRDRIYWEFRERYGRK